MGQLGTDTGPLSMSIYLLCIGEAKASNESIRRVSRIFTKQFWNMVRLAKRGNTIDNDISIQTIYEIISLRSSVIMDNVIVMY